MPTPSRYDLTGRTVAIIGASKGMGRVMALTCAEAGADLVLGARQQPELEVAAKECAAFGHRVWQGTIDLAHVASINAFVEAAIAATGGIDVLVNNAALTIVKPSVDFTEAEFDQLCDINFKGVFFTGNAVARHMIATGRKGAIVNISSQTGHVGAPLRAAYGATKGALNQLTKTWAGEWAPHGIRVNGVSPTFTRSPTLDRAMQNPEFRAMVGRVPLGRPAEAQDIASAVLFLASDAASMITGHTMLVDGGYTTIRT